MSECIFCKIINGEIPCYKIYEDDNILAFLDISPVNKGHALVIPKKHYETILEISEDDLCRTLLVVKKLSGAIMTAMNANGLNISINNYKAAGQLVPHLHVHIIPRFSKDGLKFDWPAKKIKEREFKEIADKIKKVLK